jgi:hypothetical protein
MVKSEASRGGGAGLIDRLQLEVYGGSLLVDNGLGRKHL